MPIDEFIFNNRDKISDEEIDLIGHHLTIKLSEMNLSHRDIHSRNILFTEDDGVVLIDFKNATQKSEIKPTVVSVFKSASNNDVEAIRALVKYLKDVRNGGQITRMYNPKINQFIRDQIKLAFPSFNNEAMVYKNKLVNFSKYFLEKYHVHNNNEKQISTASMHPIQRYFFEFSDQYGEQLEAIRVGQM